MVFERARAFAPKGRGILPVHDRRRRLVNELIVETQAVLRQRLTVRRSDLSSQTL